MTKINCQNYSSPVEMRMKLLSESAWVFIRMIAHTGVGRLSMQRQQPQYIQYFKAKAQPQMHIYNMFSLSPNLHSSDLLQTRHPKLPKAIQKTIKKITFNTKVPGCESSFEAVGSSLVPCLQFLAACSMQKQRGKTQGFVLCDPQHRCHNFMLSNV